MNKELFYRYFRWWRNLWVIHWNFEFPGLPTIRDHVVTIQGSTELPRRSSWIKCQKSCDFLWQIQIESLNKWYTLMGNIRLRMRQSTQYSFIVISVWHSKQCTERYHNDLWVINYVTSKLLINKSKIYSTVKIIPSNVHTIFPLSPADFVHFPESFNPKAGLHWHCA